MGNICFCSIMKRVCKEVFCAPVFDKLTVVNEQYMIGKPARLRHIMGCHDNRCTVFMCVFNQGLYFCTGFKIEIGLRFIQKQQVRFTCQRANECQFLLFAT